MKIRLLETIDQMRNPSKANNVEVFRAVVQTEHGTFNLMDRDGYLEIQTDDGLLVVPIASNMIELKVQGY